ncbi:MAG: carboxypeptidase-like regulatory domain-containing protein [Bacteroidales bacterium]|nr:carboxypeptidase-like regulatory domain-containing protein [Bacteroidales bacterium]
MTSPRIFIFGILILLSSCSKQTLVPDLEGSLVGYAYTFDEFANQLPDRSGVLVTAVGGKNSTAYTDEQGRFEIAGLATGTYELRFEKPGFGTLKQFGIQHLGGMPTTLGLSYSGSINSSAFFIYEIPQTKVTAASVSGNKLSCSFSFKVPEPQNMSVILYLSETDGFRTADAGQTIGCYLTKDGNSYTCILDSRNLVFGKGQKIYGRVCQLMRRGAVTDYVSRIIAGIDTYNDLTTNALIYPNLGNESEQFSFIVP